MMYVARFKDSKMAIARRKTEHAAWLQAKLHEIADHLIEVVSEAQHLQDGHVEYATTHYNHKR